MDHLMKPPRAIPAAVVITAIAAALAGCGSFGPHTVPHDRFDYTAAIASSWQEQMLLNIVKLRYGDTPVFLDVASVINQYLLQGTVDLRFTWVHPVTAVGDSKSIGGSGVYAERPTITYTPLAGERFARSLMKPLPPPSVMGLIEAGYPIDAVMRVCVNSINGVRNHYGGAARARQADPEFYPLIERMRKLQATGAIGLRMEKTPGAAPGESENEALVMIFRKKVTPEMQEDSRFVRKTLGLDPDAETLRIGYGSVAKDDKEVALLTRSVLEILIELGSYIEVPPDDVRDKRCLPTMAAETSPASGAAIPPLIRIQSSPSKPSQFGFVAVPYRGQYFWIDDRDMRSKSLFTFLMFIFSLTETQGKEAAPIVTIPAG
jgi:hypothetical protein